MTATHDKIIAGAGHAKAASEIGATGKPSVARGTVGGGASGAAKGAAAGTLFGPEGTVIGAAGGAAIGAAGGGVKAHRAKAAARKARVASLGPGRQALVAEFIVCMIILALSPLTDRHQSEGPQAFIKRAAATCAVFFILGLFGATGRGPAKIAAMGGGLITLSLMVSDRDVFAALASKIGGSGSAGGPGQPDDPGTGLDPSGQVSDSSGGSNQIGLDPSGTAGTNTDGGPLGNGIR